MRNDLKGYEGEGTLTLQVAAQIIQKISSGLYRSPESALKELVSNAFDADATEVRIQFVFSKHRGTERLSKVRVRDNGVGMDINKLKYVFTHVGGSLKERLDFGSDPVTETGRPIIGRLGIGMLSIASACEVFLVKTKKKGEFREYLAEVNLEYLRDETKRSQSMDVFSIGNVGLYSKSVNEEFGQYTEIEISKFTPPFMESIQNDLKSSFIYNNGKVVETKNDRKNEIALEEYFVKLMNWTIEGGRLINGRTRINTGKLNSAHPLDAAVFNLGLMAPVQYLSNGPIKSTVTMNGKTYTVPGTDDVDYLDLKDRYKRYNFNVYFETYTEYPSGDVYLRSRFKVYKPLLYPRDSDLNEIGFEALNPRVYIIKPVEANVPVDDEINTHTSLKGYYYHQERRILPQEYRGILFRVYNIAIGSRFQDDLKLYITSSVVLWQSLCEIYLDKGFQMIVNLDRESLYEGNNVFRHLRYFLENTLTGKIPEKLETSANSSVSSVERKFYWMEMGLLKKGSGLIGEIRKGREKTEKEEPWDKFKEELLKKENCKSLRVTGRTSDPAKISITKVKTALHVVLPDVQGDKMWDAIFISLYLNTSELGRETRTKILEATLSIYRDWKEE